VWEHDATKKPAQSGLGVRSLSPFFLFGSWRQFAFCSFVAIGAGFIASLLVSVAAAPYAAIGAFIGLAPAIWAASPCELTCRPEILNAIRVILAKGQYAVHQRQGFGQPELWVLRHKNWRLPWTETNISIHSDGELLRVRGPRTVIRQLYEVIGKLMLKKGSE
jgi:hypothetical protein